jgi:hypothetical protein
MSPFELYGDECRDLRNWMEDNAPEDVLVSFRRLCDFAMHRSSDAEYRQAIIDGSWPTSDHLIRMARGKWLWVDAKEDPPRPYSLVAKTLPEAIELLETDKEIVHVAIGPGEGHDLALWIEQAAKDKRIEPLSWKGPKEDQKFMEIMLRADRHWDRA